MTKLNYKPNYEHNISVIIRSTDAEGGYIKVRAIHNPDAEITQTHSFYIPNLSTEEALKRAEEHLNKLQNPYEQINY